MKTKPAGFVRNQQMADAEADLCLAFIDLCHKPGCRQYPVPHGSHGASDCATRAQWAGIETRTEVGR